jgi:hypothetical protein
VLHQQEYVYEMTNLEKTTLLGNQVNNKVKVDTEVGIHEANATIQKEKAMIDQKLKETLEGLKNRGVGWG